MSEIKKYAVIETGGKQYLVQEGMQLDVEKLENKTVITFKEVLLTVQGEEVRIGHPHVEGAKVKAKIVDQIKGPKIKGFKFSFKMKYGKRYGHRQPLTRIEVEEIIV